MVRLALGRVGEEGEARVVPGNREMEERRSVMTSVVENREEQVEEQVEGTEETGIMREVEQDRVEHTIQGEAEEATGLVGVARGNSREEDNLGAEEQRVVEGEMTTKGSRKKVEKQGVDVVAVATSSTSKVIRSNKEEAQGVEKGEVRARRSRRMAEEGGAVVRRRSEVEECGSVEAKRPRSEAQQLTIKSEPQPQQEVGLEVLQARCLAPNLGKF